MDFRAHWRGRERFVIFDADHDRGAFASWLDAWRADPQRPAHLHVIAIAGGPLPGFERILQDDDAVTLDLLHAPLEAALARLATRIDGVLLHGLGQAGAGFARPLARLLAPDASLHAAGLTAAQQAALSASGWVFDPQRISARFASRKPARPAPPAVAERRAVVIGAGLAGSAACERLCARGWQVTLVERHAQPAMEASGNLAGITMPLLSKDDNSASRLSRAAFLFALRYWQRLGGIGAAIDGALCGVLQLAKDAPHAGLQRQAAALRNYPPAFAEWLDGEQAAGRFGRLAPHGAWLFPQGGWIRPASACQAMLDACGPRLQRRFDTGSVRLDFDGEQWRVLDAAGMQLARAPVAILANGAGAAQLAQAAHLPLALVRGQVTHLAADRLPQPGLVLCREAYLTPPANGIISAGATYDEDHDPELRASSQQENLERLRSMLGDPGAALDAPLAGRVGFRSVAPDRLPMVGALPDPAAGRGTERLRELARQPGLYGLLAYASRGLTWAPLAAELLAASLDGEPLPLEADLAAALDPGRFVLRRRRAAR